MASPASADPSNKPERDNVPEQRQPPKLPRRAMILGLVVAGFAAFFFPLYLISANVRGANTRLETNIQSVQATLTSVYAPAPDDQELMDKLAQLQASAAEIEQAYNSAMAGSAERRPWQGFSKLPPRHLQP